MYAYHGIGPDLRVELILSPKQDLEARPRVILTDKGPLLVIDESYDFARFADTIIVRADVWYDDKRWHATIRGGQIELKPILG